MMQFWIFFFQLNQLILGREIVLEFFRHFYFII